MLSAPFLVIAGAISSCWGFAFEPRSGQTGAVCSVDFSWADNTKGVSPCQLAANIDALCNSGNWIIQALNASVNYPDPKGGTATFCTCSWASYNLIGACSACQGFPEKISIWDAYILNCGGLLSTSYFPSNITLPTDTVIPYWAVQDPTQWTNRRLDPAAAKTLASQGHADVTNAYTSTVAHKAKPIGAIVGGVVGGLIVLSAAIAIAWRMLRQKDKVSKLKHTPSSSGHQHLRSDSDVSQYYTTTTYTSPMTTNPLTPSSPTIRTHHGSSVRSQPFTNSMIASIAPYGSASPPPVREVPANREDMITPFTLPPTNDNPDRKQSSGGFPVFDSPNAPPPGRATMEVLPSTPVQQGRTRYNPPTYADSQSPQSGSNTPSTSRRPHAKKGSSDTHDSISSPSPGTRHTGGHNRSESVSVITNGSVGITPAGGSVTPTHGRQVSTSRDEKRRPTDDSINPRDIA